MAGQVEAMRTEIEAAIEELLETVGSLNADELLRRTPNEGWTGKDTLAHLSTITSRQREQVEAALAGQPYAAESVDDFNDRKVLERKSWTVDQLRTELQQERDATLALLTSLTEEDMNRPFDHPRRGRITVAGLWENIPQHFRNHTADIRAVKS